jgi:hypothetical protein
MLRRSFLSLFPIPFLSSLPIFKTAEVPELKFGLVDGLYRMVNAEELMENVESTVKNNNKIKRRVVKLTDIIDGSQGSSFTGEGVLNEIRTSSVAVYLVTESENSKRVRIVNDYESKDV